MKQATVKQGLFKRTLVSFCAILLLFALFVPSVFAQTAAAPALPTASVVDLGAPEGLQAKSIYLVHLGTGQVVYAQNENEKRPPASVTKIMTLLLAVESGLPMDTKITAPANLWAEFAGISISNAGIRAGEVMTLKDLIYCAALPSANEAAAILADFLGEGSRTKFLSMMNQRAKELGANNTHFSDPYGLADENHYTTAKDLYLIARAAFSNPTFLEVVSTPGYTLSQTNFHAPREIKNTNAMFRQDSPYYFEGVVGGKTGSTPAAGRCFVGMFDKASSTGDCGREQYISVVLGAPLLTEWGGWRTDNTALQDTKNLMTWAYDLVGQKQLAKKEQQLATLSVDFCKEYEQIPLVAKEPLTALLPKDKSVADVTVQVLPAADKLQAPIEKGAPAGEAVFYDGDLQIGRVALVTGVAAQRDGMMYFVYQLGVFWQSYWLVVLLFLAVLCLLCVLLAVIRRRNARRRIRRRRYRAR